MKVVNYSSKDHHQNWLCLHNKHNVKVLFSSTATTWFELLFYFISRCYVLCWKATVILSASQLGTSIYFDCEFFW